MKRMGLLKHQRAFREKYRVPRILTSSGTDEVPLPQSFFLASGVQDRKPCLDPREQGRLREYLMQSYRHDCAASMPSACVSSKRGTEQGFMAKRTIRIRMDGGELQLRPRDTHLLVHAVRHAEGELAVCVDAPGVVAGATGGAQPNHVAAMGFRQLDRMDRPKD